MWYTFTPAAGQCASPVSVKVTVANCTVKKNDVLAGDTLSAKNDEADQAAIGVGSTAAVYPNPSVNTFNLVLKSPTMQKVEIRVMDVMGHLLHHTSGDATGTYQFGSNFVKGIYFVEVIYQKGTKTLKAIRQQRDRESIFISSR